MRSKSAIKINKLLQKNWAKIGIDKKERKIQ